MKLLYFATHQIWPLTSGARLRDYYLARGLAAHASVTLIEMCKRGELPSSLPRERPMAKLVSLRKDSRYSPIKFWHGLVGPRPLTVLDYFERGSALILASILAGGGFDAVQVEGVHLSEYLPVIQAAPNHPPILVDWHNIESELMRRYAENTPDWPKRLVARRTADLLERAELQLLRTGAVHTVTSERERMELVARYPPAAVHVIPNGVDAQHFSAASIAETRLVAGTLGSRQTLLFVGSMDYHANIDAVTWFVREIWSGIAQRHAELTFVIAGRNPSAAVRALESKRVVVTGTVEDMRPFYASALAIIVPLRVGSGTRLKILEAMAAGVPVVSTRLGVEGIDISDNVHFLLADRPAEITAAVNHVVTSPEARSRLTAAARDLVASRYNWSRIGEELLRIHRRLISKQTGFDTAARVVEES